MGKDYKKEQEIERKWRVKKLNEMIEKKEEEIKGLKQERRELEEFRY